MNPLGRRALPLLHFQFPDVRLGTANGVGYLLQRQLFGLS
jgi:hypothetical protein